MRSRAKSGSCSESYVRRPPTVRRSAQGRQATRSRTAISTSLPPRSPGPRTTRGQRQTSGLEPAARPDRREQRRQVIRQVFWFGRELMAAEDPFGEREARAGTNSASVADEYRKRQAQWLASRGRAGLAVDGNGRPARCPPCEPVRAPARRRDHEQGVGNTADRVRAPGRFSTGGQLRSGPRSTFTWIAAVWHHRSARGPDASKWPPSRRTAASARTRTWIAGQSRPTRPMPTAASPSSAPRRRRGSRYASNFEGQGAELDLTAGLERAGCRREARFPGDGLQHVERHHRSMLVRAPSAIRSRARRAGAVAGPDRTKPWSATKRRASPRVRTRSEPASTGSRTR